MPASFSKNTHPDPLNGLQEKIGYSFKDRGLLVTALTHKSYFHENPEKAPGHNERLEFLGDSVLGFAVSDYLFRLGEEFPESVMSKIKSHAVKGAVLYETALWISLGGHLLLGKGEEETGGRLKRSILYNALEAVIGAVFVDGGYEASAAVVMRLLKGRIDAMIESGDLFDFKTSLQEESQMRFGLLPEYRVVKEEGKEHKRVFTSEVFVAGKNYGSGTARTKKEAEGIAAKEAIERLKGRRGPKST